MGLQENIDAQIAAIHDGLDQASNAAGDLGGQIEGIDDDQQIDLGAIADGFSAVADGFLHVADAIDLLAGDSAAIRASAANVQTIAEGIEDGSVSLAAVKTALSGVVAAVTPHGAASSAMAGLLIDQSNFSGEDQ